jgi:O-acetyl-ADP-ribose deacetylase (regulator of RNase III)
MKILNIVLGLMLYGTYANAQVSAPIEINLSDVKVKVLLGNIVDQETEALALSHWPTGINDGGGVGGAIASAGGQSSLDQLQKILEANGGQLPYASVYPTQVGASGRLKAHTLLNVIELAPIRQLHFKNLSELEDSHIPLLPADIVIYRALLAKYEFQIKTYEAALSEVQERLKQNSSKENMEKLITIIRRGTGTNFEQERNLLLEKYKKPVGFETVALSVQNTLAKAVELKIKSVSFATMGFGVVGDLTMTESLASMLTGISTFDLPKGAELEVRIVIYAQDNLKNRNWMISNLLPVIKNGKFLDMAEKNGVGKNRGIDLSAVREVFKALDLNTLVAAKPTGFARIKSFCEDALRKPIEFFRGD